MLALNFFSRVCCSLRSAARPIAASGLVFLLSFFSWFASAASESVPVLTLAEAPKARIAVVGGTFLNDIFFYQYKQLVKKEFTIETKLGPSPKIYYAQWEGVPFYYVHNHGDGNYQQTWLALYDLGVEEAIGGATAGAINRKMKTYDYVVPHDLIDMNISRPLGFPKEVYRDPNAIPLPRMTPAMDTDIRNILIAESKKVLKEKGKKFKVHHNAVLVQARGGRFETVAEIKMFEKWGGDIVTMSVGTEMVFARQLGINYATLVVISNPAEGIAPWDFSEMSELYPTVNPLSMSIVLNSLKPVAALKGKPRVSDGLINHPEMTSQPQKEH